MSDITLTVQANDVLTDTWTDLAQSVSGAAFALIHGSATISESGTGNARALTVGDLFQVTDPAHPRRFMRLKVTAP